MASKSKKNHATNDSTDRKAPVTKKERLQAMLRRKGGASTVALQKEFGWQPHTVRAAISGVRKAGVTVLCVTSKSGSVYRISGARAGR